MFDLTATYTYYDETRTSRMQGEEVSFPTKATYKYTAPDGRETEGLTDMPYGMNTALRSHGLVMSTIEENEHRLSRQREAGRIDANETTRKMLISWFQEQNYSTDTMNSALRALQFDEYTGKFEVEVTLWGDEVCTVTVIADDEDDAEEKVREAMSISEIRYEFSCSGEGIEVQGYVSDVTSYEDENNVFDELSYSVSEYTG